MRIVNTLRKLFFKASLYFYNDYTVYKAYSKYLGVRIGMNSRILGKVDFGSEPFLIEIGNNVTITHGVAFITHDGGVGLFRKEYPGINVFGRITIGNNVFIGVQTIILPNVTIGSNVIVGAGSLLTKNIPDNVVVAGVPAKIIRTIDEYKSNCIKRAIYVNEIVPNKRREAILNELNKLSKL